MVAVDSTKNVLYVGGSFVDTLRFAHEWLPGYGQADAFLAAFTLPNLDLLWMEAWGGFADDRLMALTVTKDGPVAALACGGRTMEMATFRVGSTTFSGRGNYDIVLVGNAGPSPSWIRHDGAEFNDIPAGLTFDSNNNVYLSFTFSQRTIIGSRLITDASASCVGIAKVDGEGSVKGSNYLASWESQSYGSAMATAGVTFAGDSLVTQIGGGGRFRWGSKKVDTDDWHWLHRPILLYADTASLDALHWKFSNGCDADSTLLVNLDNELWTVSTGPARCNYSEAPEIRLGVIGSAPATILAVPNSTSALAAVAAQNTGIIVAGTFTQTLDLGPTHEPLTAEPPGGKNAFLVIFNHSGKVNTALRFGTNIEPTSIADHPQGIFTSIVMRTAKSEILPPNSAAIVRFVRRPVSVYYDITDPAPCPNPDVFDLTGRFLGTQSVLRERLAPGCYLLSCSPWKIVIPW